MDRIQAELGYKLDIPIRPPILVTNTNEGKVVQPIITPQPITPVKIGSQTNVEITGGKRENHPYVNENGKFKPGNKGGGRPKKPKDIIQSLTEEAERARAKTPDGTDISAAGVIAKKAWDLAIDGDMEAIKWITERLHGKVPNINQNTNVNADFQQIMDEIKGRKRVVENEAE